MRPLPMVSTLIFPLQLLYLSTFILTSFALFLVFPTANGIDVCYKNCSSLISCGKIPNIGYPFWMEGQRPKYCGHPALELQCFNDKNLVLTLHGDHEEPLSSYKVLDISNSTMKIRLTDSLPAPPEPLAGPSHHQGLIPCHNPPTFHNVLLNYSSTVQNINLFYECGLRGIAVGANHSITCGEDQTAYYLRNSSRPKFCKKHTKVPVLRKELHNLDQGTETLEDVLKKGFQVDFSEKYMEACLHCEQSGGKCGSMDYYNFYCFCKDAAYPHSCPKSERQKLKLMLGIAIPVDLLILTAVIAGIFSCNKRRFRSQTLVSGTKSHDHVRSDLEIGNSFFGIPVFSYTELQEATNNFNPDQILGDGGFGVVYYGKLRDGREVAVKHLYERNYKRVGQFMNEVEILTKLKHPNLMTLFGCTSRHSRELLLVYEYIPNGTVADHLHGDRSESTPLAWTIRMKIAIQTAGALSYLHASDIMHRDVKTNNILLDNNFSVKVADFGLSRLFPLDATHVSTAPQGTPGYLDPEYRKCYRLTNKSDVYSFGVVLVELISSLPAINISTDEDESKLSTYAMNKIQQGVLDELVDQKLGFKSDFKVNSMVTLVAELAFRCLQEEREIRPSMEEVLGALKQIESEDYESLQAEEMSGSFGISRPASGAAESEVQKPFRNAQNPNSSPKSVMDNWVSGSTISDTSG